MKPIEAISKYKEKREVLKKWWKYAFEAVMMDIKLQKSKYLYLFDPM